MESMYNHQNTSAKTMSKASEGKKRLIYAISSLSPLWKPLRFKLDFIWCILCKPPKKVKEVGYFGL